MKNLDYRLPYKEVTVGGARELLSINGAECWIDYPLTESVDATVKVENDAMIKFLEGYDDDEEETVCLVQGNVLFC